MIGWNSQENSLGRLFMSVLGCENVELCSCGNVEILDAAKVQKDVEKWNFVHVEICVPGIVTLFSGTVFPG